MTLPGSTSAQGEDLPLVLPLADGLDAEQVFLRLAGKPWCLFLDSARRHPVLGRYSFLTADPFETLLVPADGSDGLAQLAQLRRPVPYRARGWLAAVSRRRRGRLGL